MTLMLTAVRYQEQLRVRIPAATVRAFQGTAVPAGSLTQTGVVRGTTTTTDLRPRTSMV